MDSKHFQEDLNSKKSAKSYDEVYSLPHNIEAPNDKTIVNSIHKICGEVPSIMVDIGCGDSKMLDYFASYGWKTIGIDLSLIGISKGKARNKSDYILGNALYMPIKDGTLKMVFSSGLSLLNSYNDEKSVEILASFKNILTKNGFIVVAWSTNLSGKWHEVGSWRNFRPREMKQLMKGAGFDNVKTFIVLRSKLPSWHIPLSFNPVLKIMSSLLAHIVAKFNKRIQFYLITIGKCNQGGE